MRRSAAALLLALAACGDGPTGADRNAPDFLLLSSGSAIQCQGSTASGGSLQCGGGDGTVEVAVSNVAYNAGSGTFSFGATVRNRIPQPIGTVNGITLDPAGVRVFFASGPVITSGAGFITVLNNDGSATFSSGSRKYFQYNTVLDSGAVSSARTWQLSMPSIVGTFAFTLAVSAAVPYPNGWVEVSRDSAFVLVGGTRKLNAVSRSAVGAIIPGTVFTWGLTGSNPSVPIPCGFGTAWSGSGGCVGTGGDHAAVDARGVVGGFAPGTEVITVTDGTRTGSVRVQVCPLMFPGDVEAVTTPAADGFCLAGHATGAEYTLVLTNTAASAAPFSVRGRGIVAASGPPAPTHFPAAGARLSGRARPLPDGAWEWRLRERERRELAGRVASPRSGVRSARSGPRRTIVPGVPIPGDLMDLNVATNPCTTNDLRTGEVKAVGPHVVVMADVANPSGGLTTVDYQSVATRFETQVWPVISANFGVPEDVDANERVVLFFTRAVNQATASGAFIPGYFLTRDLFSTLSCPTSNLGEVIYVLAADPSGTINGNARSVAFVRDSTALHLAHEMQHLVSASRRLLVNNAPFAEVWLDEGLSAIAEELLFHQAAGTQPRQNLDNAALTASSAVAGAFAAYAEPNFARLRQWLEAPTGNGLFQADSDAATRGAAWAYLRYVADVQPGSQPVLWNALVNSSSAGIGAVPNGLARVREFTAATYADDTGLGVMPVWTHPSWNFRSIYGARGGFPLAVRDPANEATDAFTLAGGGGAAYVRMGVSANGFASVTLPTGASAFPASANLVLIRRK